MNHNVTDGVRPSLPTLRLAMHQMRNLGSVEKNLESALEAIRTASEHGADLILFPEVQLTDFFPQYPGRNVSNYGLTLDSDVVRRLRNACRKHHIIGVPNIYLEEDGRHYDASLLIDTSGDIVGVQKMVHVAQAECFFEQDYYTPSDDGFKVFDTPFGRIGIVVCFDRHYPESIRTEALMGADLILIPTVNTKQEPMDMFAIELQAQAFQNSVFIAMCNRVGSEGAMDFAGESIVIDPNGEVRLHTDDQPQLIYADLDLNLSASVRRARPYTLLRRLEMYR